VIDVDELLEQLPQVATQGYAASDAEWESGLRSIAAPVRSRERRVVAAVCAISVQPGVTIRLMERDYLPAVLKTAGAISAALGFTC
jgi:DNA-binding IclR family transcriptional regulator